MTSEATMTFADILHLSTSLMMAAPLIMVWWTFRPRKPATPPTFSE